MTMNKVTIKKVAQWIGFGTVLMTALAISWWSMFTMAMDEFGMPGILAGAVSVAFDGAALYVALLASEYAKSDDSGFMARLATLGFVTVSAWLNFMHADMMGLGIEGKVFFSAPTIIAGILFEMFLKFTNKTELRKRGRVAKAMPVFGKISWFRYPAKTFKSFSKVVLFRLDNVTAAETAGQKDTVSVPEAVTEGQGQQDTKRTVTAAQKDTQAVRKDTKKVVTKKVTRTPSAKELEDTFPELSEDMSIARLVQTMYRNGETDREAIRKKVSNIKKTEVPINTVTKSINRMK
ncbi:DUF2637 domain-containing protein [Streptomyces sp. B1I3]|uniref:DUF2637 domain-containing protein n=1 Tax=Streptomyces sp. B1I3 TaxID=3042264 RepID=UPI0027D78FE9|nr:DUF2637 domain-containing protein [Streptomyces sp. B1I3]